MHIQTRRDFLLDLMQELHELLATMARQATADDFTVDDIESREQRRGAMAFVIMAIWRWGNPGRSGRMGAVRSRA